MYEYSNSIEIPKRYEFQCTNVSRLLTITYVLRSEGCFQGIRAVERAVGKMKRSRSPGKDCHRNAHHARAKTTEDNVKMEVKREGVNSFMFFVSSVSINSPPSVTKSMSKIPPAKVVNRRGSQTHSSGEKKTNSSGEKRSVKERYIGSARLPREYKSDFRIALPTNSPLEDDYIWQLMLDDLTIIGFLGNERTSLPEESFQYLCPLSATNLGVKGSLYKSVFKQLPPLYSMRLSLLRMLGHFSLKNSLSRVRRKKGLVKCLKKEAIHNFVRFFEQIVTAPPLERERNFRGSDACSTKRIRIDLTTVGIELFSISTWQPTICTEFIRPLIETCKLLGMGEHRLGIPKTHFFKSYPLSAHPCVDHDHLTLESYCWESWKTFSMSRHKKSISHARMNLIYMLCAHVELCGLAAMRQLWGNGKLYDKQCLKIKKYVEGVKNDDSRCTQANPRRSSVIGAHGLKSLPGFSSEMTRWMPSSSSSLPTQMVEAESEESKQGLM